MTTIIVHENQGEEGVQSAIDSLEGGTVIAETGRFWISQGIQMKNNVHLHLRKGAEFYVAANVDVITMANNSELSGGYINCGSLPDFDKSAVVLNASNHFAFVQAMTRISNLIIHRGLHKGNGIYFLAEGVDQEMIVGVQIQNVNISQFEYGIKLESRKPASGTTWINGNLFNQICLYDCKNHVSVLGSRTMPNPANGNVFSQIRATCGPNTVRALYCETSYNMFLGFHVWDPQNNPDSTRMEFTPSSKHNRFVGLCYPSYISDLGSKNHIETVGF